MLRTDNWPTEKQAHIDDHRALHRSHNECLGVADFASFADALRAVPAGGTLYVPEVYRIESAIVIDKPLRLYGAGGLLLASSGLIVIDADDVWWDGLSFAGDTNNLSLLGAVETEHHGWRFERCTFGIRLSLTRPGRTLQNGVVSSIGTGLAQRALIRACEFAGYAAGYALELAGVHDVVVRDCWLHDVGIDDKAGDAIKVLAGSYDVTLAHCTIERATRDAIDLFDASRVTISGGVIRDCGMYAVDGKAGTSPNPTGEHTIIGLRADRCVHGIVAGEGSTVLGCSLRNHRDYGLLVQQPGVIAVGNHISGCGIADVRLDVDNPHISLNVYDTIEQR